MCALAHDAKTFSEIAIFCKSFMGVGMKRKYGRVRETLVVCLIALSIPLLLIAGGMQARKYEDLSDEVSALEKKQEALVEENKKLVTDISLLASTERIEKIAENELGMHKAQTDDIVRVEMKGNGSAKSDGAK